MLSRFRTASQKRSKSRGARHRLLRRPSPSLPRARRRRHRGRARRRLLVLPGGRVRQCRAQKSDEVRAASGASPSTGNEGQAARVRWSRHPRIRGSGPAAPLGRNPRHRPSDWTARAPRPRRNVAPPRHAPGLARRRRTRSARRTAARAWAKVLFQPCVSTRTSVARRARISSTAAGTCSGWTSAPRSSNSTSAYGSRIVRSCARSAIDQSWAGGSSSATGTWSSRAPSFLLRRRGVRAPPTLRPVAPTLVAPFLTPPTTALPARRSP